MHTKAHKFDEDVRERHGLPIMGFYTCKRYGISDVIHSPRYGAMMVTQVIFDDGSYYNVGHPEQGPQYDEEQETDVEEAG